MKRVFAVFIFSTLACLAGQAQHTAETHSTTRHEPERLNNVGLFIGNTIIVQSGFNLPTLGIEYVRELRPWLGLGLITELELGSHIIKKDEDGNIITEVSREQAMLLLPVAEIRLYRGLILYGGYGVELEKNENLGLMKTGLKYRLRLHQANWEVIPDVSWDHTRLFDGVVYGFIFAYKF